MFFYTCIIDFFQLENRNSRCKCQRALFASLFNST